MQDIGALCFIREAFPDLAVHTSTQMTITNRYGAELMKSYGANRVVTAREMSFEEIKDIHDHVDIEIESFVHGALCYCYSGQCLLSSMLGGRREIGADVPSRADFPMRFVMQIKK